MAPGNGWEEWRLLVQKHIQGEEVWRDLVGKKLEKLQVIEYRLASNDKRNDEIADSLEEIKEYFSDVRATLAEMQGESKTRKYVWGTVIPAVVALITAASIVAAFVP